MIRSKKVRLLLAAILTAIVASCSGVNDSVRNPQAVTTSADCRTIAHQMGETEICGKPQRVVALGPDMLELLVALDVQPVGFADYVRFHKGDYNNPQQQIPYLGNRLTTPVANVGWSASPSMEALVKAQPDLILSQDLNPEIYKTLSKIAPTLFLKRFDTPENLRAIATAIDTPQVEQVLVNMQQNVQKARQDFATTVASHPQVLLLIATGNEMRLMSATDNLCGSLIEDLGFQLVYPPNFKPSQQNPSLPISLEKLPELNQADSVIVLGFDFGVDSQSTTIAQFETSQVASSQQIWQKNAIAQSLAASKAGRTYFIPAYKCLGLPGPIGTQLYLDDLQKMR